MSRILCNWLQYSSPTPLICDLWSSLLDHQPDNARRPLFHCPTCSTRYCNAGQSVPCVHMSASYSLRPQRCPPIVPDRDFIVKLISSIFTHCKRVIRSKVSHEPTENALQASFYRRILQCPLGLPSIRLSVIDVGQMDQSWLASGNQDGRTAFLKREPKFQIKAHGCALQIKFCNSSVTVTAEVWFR